MKKIKGKYTRKNDHLFVRPEGGDSLKLGGDIAIIGIEQRVGSEDYNVVFEFDTIRGRTRISMPKGDLLEGYDLIKKLENKGYKVSNREACKTYLRGYFEEHTPDVFTIRTPALGWIENEYLWPETTVVIDNVTYAFERSKNAHIINLDTKGELTEWKDKVFDLCWYSDLLILIVCAAFAAIIRVMYTDISGGGIMLFGGSSSGKTSATRIGQSVSGKPDKRNLFGLDATRPALEETAIEHQHLLLTMDEVGIIDKSDAVKKLQMISFRFFDMREMGKSAIWKAQKAGQAGSVTETSTDVLYVITGEQSIKELASSVGGSRLRGSELRLTDVPCSRADSVIGIFDSLPAAKEGEPTPEKIRAARLIERIVKNAEKYHGTAGRAFTGYLSKLKSKDVRKRINAYAITFKEVAEAQTPVTEPWQRRVLERFALYSAGGKLALDAEVITGAHKRIDKAIANCFARAMTYAASDASDVREDLATLRARVNQIESVSGSGLSQDMLLQRYGGVIDTVDGKVCALFKRASLENMLGSRGAATRLIKSLDKKGCLIKETGKKPKRSMRWEVSGRRTRYFVIPVDKLHHI